jgi:hypothetical protein
MISKLDDIPAGCEPATIGLEEFQLQMTLSPADLVDYFRANPHSATRLLQQSYDQRYTPSTFIEETDSGYRVGWFDRERMHVRHFGDIAEAAADYLLFSFGRGRLRTDAT